MLQVMLCGASDTDRVRTEFAEVIGEFGGEPWHYLNGKILHVNHANANWAANSRASVRKADLCVFVIVERYGELTWSTELTETLNSGKSFLVLCLDSTYARYLTLKDRVADLDAITDPSDRALVTLIREIETDQQVTVVPFQSGYFRQVLRWQMATLFSQALEQLGERNLRQSTIAMLNDAGRQLSPRELGALAALACDEFEDKNSRKRALHALMANGGLGLDDVLALLRSPEQGVQRLVASELGSLYQARPPAPELFADAVDVANGSDDVGIPRRLVRTLLEIDLAGAISALSEFDFTDSGMRRRLATELENCEVKLKAEGLTGPARELARRCVEVSSDNGWLERCRAFIARLGEN